MLPQSCCCRPYIHRRGFTSRGREVSPMCCRLTWPPPLLRTPLPFVPLPCSAAPPRLFHLFSSFFHVRLTFLLLILLLFITLCHLLHLLLSLMGATPFCSDCVWLFHQFLFYNFIIFLTQHAFQLLLSLDSWRQPPQASTVAPLVENKDVRIYSPDLVAFMEVSTEISHIFNVFGFNCLVCVVHTHRHSVKSGW